MSSPKAPANQATSNEERAFFARLAALNVAVESTRAGKTAQSFCQTAQASESLLAAFLDEISAAPVKE